MVRNILRSAKGSILLNGKAKNYFHFKRGVRQGDPLSPMLFNLGVNVLAHFFEKAKENGWWKGWCIGKDRVNLSLLQYADDTLIFCEDNVEEIKNLKGLLRMFSLTSGLEINYKKSSVIGINTTMDTNLRYAQILGCQTEKLPIN